MCAAVLPGHADANIGNVPGLASRNLLTNSLALEKKHIIYNINRTLHAPFKQSKISSYSDIKNIINSKAFEERNQLKGSLLKNVMNKTHAYPLSVPLLLTSCLKLQERLLIVGKLIQLRSKLPQSFQPINHKSGNLKFHASDVLTCLSSTFLCKTLYSSS